MPVTLAFDIYGTLLDTHGDVTVLEKIIGENAKHFSQTWRDKQLEYSFRRGLMKKYDLFSVCIHDALEYTCQYYKATLSKEEKNTLLNIYNALPAFNDVAPSLNQLKETEYKIYAFSNGPISTVTNLLTEAHIKEYFIDIISVDSIKSFKPDPAVYEHFLTATNTDINNAWLISSNPFDVMGAVSAGMKAIWVKRSEEIIFDPWDINPTVTISSLTELNERIGLYYNDK